MVLRAGNGCFFTRTQKLANLSDPVIKVRTIEKVSDES
jgi:hypothetical protein